MLYGYARLPYVDYTPALLSARCPVYDKDARVLKLKIENFGLSDSQPSEVEVRCKGVVIATASVPALAPYGEVDLQLTPVKAPEASDKVYEVIITCRGAEMERTTFN